MEGGAHVVSEAIAMGVPVIASAVSGNIGLLGDGYPGTYPYGDDKALAALLARSSGDPAWLARLGKKIAARSSIVDPARERKALARLLADLRPGA
jgi:glycosyltransferase involved in cell wall biosynthesis